MRWKAIHFNNHGWFKQIKNKNLYKFATSDIKEFYPSIRECLKCHKFCWIKKEGGLFDVTMGTFDGAEVCEAVGSFFLDQLSKNYNKKDIGLYRDDGLAIF